MKIFKGLVVSLAVASLACGYSVKSFAGGNAVVDLDKIRENYTAAQELTAELQVKEAELQTFITDAQKQIQNAKTDVEKKNLEEKLGQQFNLKRNAYAKDQAEKWGKIETDVVNSVKDISASKKLDIVLNKQAVIFGGVDITEEVIKKLNKK